MTDDLTDLYGLRAVSPARPLAGLTVLAVEDSRYCCEAIRLLCLRSGARIRRADCLRTARRHLATYRPSVVIVDLGLPDGPGEELLRELQAMTPRVPAVFAISGDTALEASALAAGADGFFAKPLESLREFQSRILVALEQAGVHRPAPVGEDSVVAPDAIALRDDLAHAAEGLDGPRDPLRLNYYARFVSGLARTAHDPTLEQAASRLSRAAGQGTVTGDEIQAVRRMVGERLNVSASF
jgi:DNA-binding response OmpR family regulator